MLGFWVKYKQSRTRSTKPSKQYKTNNSACKQKNRLDFTTFGGDKRDTTRLCRSVTLRISCISAFRRNIRCRALNARGRTTAFLAPLFHQTKKDIHSDVFLFGGDKRDRTADLMTASHALSPPTAAYAPLFHLRMVYTPLFMQLP